MKWDRQATTAAVEHLFERHTTRFDAGLDARGRPLPRGVDLRETGTLRRSFGTVIVSETAGAVVNTASHAAPVNAKYPFMGATAGDLASLDAVVLRELERLERDA